VSRMTDNRMKVSLRMVFTMISNSNVQPLHKGFVVKINGRDWTAEEGRPPVNVNGSISGAEGARPLVRTPHRQRHRAPA
jgi:hypothetical protein